MFNWLKKITQQKEREKVIDRKFECTVMFYLEPHRDILRKRFFLGGLPNVTERFYFQNIIDGLKEKLSRDPDFLDLQEAIEKISGYEDFLKDFYAKHHREFESLDLVKKHMIGKKYVFAPYIDKRGNTFMNMYIEGHEDEAVATSMYMRDIPSIAANYFKALLEDMEETEYADTTENK